HPVLIMTAQHRRFRIGSRFACFLALALGCSPTPPSRPPLATTSASATVAIAPPPPAVSSAPAIAPPQRTLPAGANEPPGVALGVHGAVASQDRYATNIGLDILKRSGNAVDAAIAVAFALAVTHPAAGNLGGGGFMMIRLKDGRTTAIDYREMAPAAATRNIYLDKNGNVIEGEGGSIEG